VDHWQLAELPEKNPGPVALLGRDATIQMVNAATRSFLGREDIVGRSWIDALTGCGVYYGAAMTEAATYRDRPVVVVGGANSAGQGALFFSRYASKVTVLTRSPLAKSMSQYLIARIEAAPNMELVSGYVVDSVRGEGHLDGITIRSTEDDSTQELDAAAMFIFIGSAPHTEMVQGLLEMDEKGYLLAGPDLPAGPAGRPRGWTLDRDPYLYETTVPGIFAVGDVRAGSGKRVAAAVGEGSGCVGMVHLYLTTV
jgi:thioredoxin reductase (NADPH)